jgi:hypothetical protein
VRLSAEELMIERHIGWKQPVYTFREAFGVDPLEWQVPYLMDVRNAAILKGRQVGASTAAAAICIRYTRHYSNFLAAIVSPSMKQSTEVKLRAKQGLERLGEELVIDSQSVLGLDNGSRIISLPGSAKSVRGWSADLLIIDEAAFLDPETFLAVRATVAATGGRTIVQSTPAAPFGHFYDLFTMEDPAWAKYTVSSEDVATISKDFLAGERAKLTDDEYAQEYQGKFAAPGMGLVDPARLKELTQAVVDGPAESIWDKIRGAQAT